ncbi:putative serine/threonine protein kinase [Talaromyces proteolyticus]|uniref:non-specific serine/threonine protein kinase n=1 Tax=Talaromyces proteolyticus TaxID=1131652 RepID=A0AAD4KWS0_9EURO|nr:putative serine/threonine protein kinase [Talaromyces proteolyticus]KAH8702598.1 putative serine/threonine protein kinase [Talaromyces proteolyticus]
MTPPPVSPVPSSTVSSKAPSTASTDHSDNGEQQMTRALEDIRISVPPNGDVLPTPPQQAKIAKPSMAHRLTRMFSERKPTPPISKDSDATRDTGSESSSDGPKPSMNGAVRPSPAHQPPSRQTSVSEKPSDGVKGRGKEKDAPVHKRFEMLDGTHKHHLKGTKRQEKLTGLLRDMLGAGKKKDDHVDDQQLSLVSSWVDQLKNERDKLAQDKKGGPNATATLVDKYGKCQEIVGRGAFGIVRISHKVNPKDSRVEQLYAVKEFRRRPQETSKKYQKRLTSEFCISSSLRHPNVIHTLDLLQDAKGDYCEVMEYCAGGDLYTLVLAAGKLEVTEADCFFKQLMRGVEYMHEMGVAHRDLKPENLLLTTHGALKITDFGNGECFRMAWEKEAHMTAGLCGSAPYIAPEEYTDKEFDPRAVDLWATGVIYMAMRTGRHLWRVARKDEDEFYERYLEGRRDEDGYAPIETLHRARCRNVIYSILDPNPGRRITASQVLKSEWVREIKLCKAGEEGY